MNTEDILLLGLKSSVTAISKLNGCILWTTDLPSGLGDGFVTVLSDGMRVYAYTYGELHCLELDTGRRIWSNELKGYGYGLASLCLPAGQSAPPPVILRRLQEQQSSKSAASGSS